MKSSYENITKDFKPEVGNPNHVRALDIMEKINKSQCPDGDLERHKNQVIYLITKR